MIVHSQFCLGFFCLNFLGVFFKEIKTLKKFQMYFQMFFKVLHGKVQKKRSHALFPTFAFLPGRSMQSSPVIFILSGIFPQQEELQEGNDKSGCVLVTATVGGTVTNMGKVGGLTSKRT